MTLTQHDQMLAMGFREAVEGKTGVYVFARSSEPPAPFSEETKKRFLDLSPSPEIQEIVEGFFVRNEQQSREPH